MPRKDGTLTKKEKDFCEEYVANGGNATKAYFKAYNCSPLTANAQGYKLVRIPELKNYIVELQKVAYEAACINAERVGLKLAEIAFSEKGDEYYNAAAQLKALDLLSKNMGLQKQVIDADLHTDINITIEE